MQYSGRDVPFLLICCENSDEDGRAIAAVPGSERLALRRQPELTQVCFPKVTQGGCRMLTPGDY